MGTVEQVQPVRPAWDDYFLGIAVAVSARADCTRARYGAVIVKDHRIVSTGYNGGRPGGPSCLAGECPRGRFTKDELPGSHRGNHDYTDCIALHAEANAIAYCSRSDMIGGTIYIAGMADNRPCDMCSKLIQAAGIERVVSDGGDGDHAK
jgi:dCMP deaminase